MSLITVNENGLYCPQGDFYIDPWKPVEKAVITHAHSDHARQGMKHYFSHHLTKPILQLRLGTQNNYTAFDYGSVFNLGDVKLSLHPAGHIIGSAQIRIEYKGEVCVVGGDHKLENDGISGAFEPLNCHTFVSESTFGLPIYKWLPQQTIFKNIIDWVEENNANETSSIFIAYALGKAQRISIPLASLQKPIYAHGAIASIQNAFIENGVPLPELQKIDYTTDRNSKKYHNNIVIAPPAVLGTTWLKRFGNYKIGICSGWMQVRGNIRRKNADAAFALSDHADWDGLLETAKLTQAEQVIVTHGYQASYAHYLNSIGIAAQEINTAFGDENANDINDFGLIEMDTD